MLPPQPGILALMDTDTQKAPWYVAGLAFQCRRCGQCCAGPMEGYVWVTEDEIAAIAEHLGITPGQLHRRYVRRIRSRYSLREVRRTRDCIFLAPESSGRRQCAVYPVRPTQCRTWPFWPANLRSPDTWARGGTKCEGINRGPLIPPDRIEALANATKE